MVCFCLIYGKLEAVAEVEADVVVEGAFVGTEDAVGAFGGVVHDGDHGGVESEVDGVVAGEEVGNLGADGNPIHAAVGFGCDGVVHLAFLDFGFCEDGWGDACGETQVAVKEAVLAPFSVTPSSIIMRQGESRFFCRAKEVWTALCMPK